jgi:hypothetical protein
METTLNIRADILEQIAGAALDRGISCSDMVHFLIQKTAKDIAKPKCIGRMVRYQDRRKPEEWHIFHIQLREDTYEYWLDLRKLLKLSVSLILANAVKKYLNKLLQKNNTDNYLFKNYIIVKEIMDNIIIWKFIWGIPPNLEKIIDFE